MDFLYDFKQAQVDRFEDAGVKVYKENRRRANAQPAKPARKGKRTANLMTTITNLIR